jgi:hypothetical protein
LASLTADERAEQRKAYDWSRRAAEAAVEECVGNPKRGVAYMVIIAFVVGMLIWIWQSGNL